MAIQITNLLEAATRQELRDWLNTNAQTHREAWVYCSVKPTEGMIQYLDVVEEAICFGWIDSTKKKIDDKMAQRISPRTKKDNWTELNRLARTLQAHPHRQYPGLSQDQGNRRYLQKPPAKILGQYP